MRILIDLQSLQTLSGGRGIGRYSLSLARAMVASGPQHRFEVLLNGAFVAGLGAVRESLLDFIDDKRIHIWHPPSPISTLDVDSRWRREAALALRHFVIGGIAPDAVHVTSLFEDVYCPNAVTDIGPSAITTAVTFFDLIPMANPAAYLSDALVRGAYDRQIGQMRQADVLLAISNHAKQEAEAGLGLLSEKVVALSGDADPQFRRIVLSAEKMAALQGRWGVRRNFLLFAGGAEPRKNLDRLIEAYGLLPGPLRQRHQLVVVAALSEEQHYRLTSLCRRFDVAPQDVRVTGRVDDETLVLLYNACRAFVFPSLHEGFGLPVLEAMRCGAAVVASNSTSIPEVLGLEQALFDPTSAPSIAEKLTAVLEDEDFRATLKAHAAVQAEKFSWRQSAQTALAAIEAAHERKTVCPPPPPPPHEGVGVGEKPRLALIASVPTTESLPWFRSLDMHYRLDIVAEPAGQDRVLYLLDGETDLDRLGAMLARHPGILWLRALPAAPPHGRPPAIVYAFGGWRAVRKIGREQGSESVDPALIGLLRAARGFIAAPEIIAVLTSEFGSLDGLAATLDEQAPDSADRLRGAIEGFAENHPLVRRDKVVGALAAITVEPGPTAADRANLAIAIREGTPTLKPRQLLVDVTMLSVNDGRTGIERVVRAMLLALIGTVPEHWRVEAVRRQGDGYLYARAFLAGLLGCPEIGLPDDPVDAGGDDVFLDMEFSLAAVQRDAELAERGQGWLLYHRLRGMKVYFAIHDILPVQLPRFFNPEIGRLFAVWLRTLPRLADGLICVSRTVRDDLRGYLGETAAPRLGYFHHGADIEASAPSAGIEEGDRVLLSRLDRRPYFLMVGTVEGRKGHAQMLAAMERLWSEGTDVGLIVIGQPGWDTGDFCAVLRRHPEGGERLIWLERASDDVLALAYDRAAGLVMASLGEGFGLPLIEAARHGLPIFCRDLPVFREVAGDHAVYFTGTESAPLAAALKDWLAGRDAGTLPSSATMPVQTWADSAGQVLAWIQEGDG